MLCTHDQQQGPTAKGTSEQSEFPAVAITRSSKDDKVNIAWLPWEPDKCPDLFPLVTEQGGNSLFLPFCEAFPELLLHELCGMCLVGFGVLER